jgi:hypothetical protein
MFFPDLLCCNDLFVIAHKKIVQLKAAFAMGLVRTSITWILGSVPVANINGRRSREVIGILGCMKEVRERGRVCLKAPPTA